MKKNVLVLSLMIAASATGISQKKNVTSAIMLAKKGQFVKAKSYIDKAIKHEDTKEKAKTWNYKAMIYAGIMSSKKEAAAEIKKNTDLGAEVMAAMTMTKKLDKKGNYSSDLRKLAAPMYNNSLNAGIESYNAKKYDKAFESFTASQQYAGILGITDSVGAYNAGMAANLINNHDGAIENYKKCIEIEYGGADVYLKLIDVYNKADKKEEAAAVLDKAKAKFPSDPAIILNEAKILLGNKEYEKAKASLEKALANDPENYSLQYAAGITYNEMEMYDKAIAAYTKALELDPTNYNSMFNMSVVHNNKVVEMNNALGEIPYDQTAKYDKAKAERNAYITEVLPFVEKAYAVEKEASLKRILNNFYRLTRQKDKIIK